MKLYVINNEIYVLKPKIELYVVNNEKNNIVENEMRINVVADRTEPL